MARTKYSMHFCVYCNKDTKMEMMNGAHGSTDKVWLRCSRCHHMSMMATQEKGATAGRSKADANEATHYTPQAIFEIGQSIFHEGWNDVGKVISKTKTSDGAQAIVVSFEKQGQRRLIENMKTEPVEDTKDVQQLLS